MANNYTVRNWKQYYYINGNTLVKPGYNQFSIIHKCLRVSEKPVYKFPDVVEIKITNKCIHECIGCSEKSCELGDNTINNDIFKILDRLPRLPLIFIISGGCILENFVDLQKIAQYIKTEFENSKMIFNICALDLIRMENLPRSFGKQYTEAFLNLPTAYCILLDSCIVNNRLVFDNIKGIDIYQKKVFRYYILKLSCSKFSNDIISDLFERDIDLIDDFSVVIITGTRENFKRDEILKFIEEQRNSLIKKPVVFDQDAYKQLGLDEFLTDTEKLIYSLGWDSYLFLDANLGESRNYSRFGSKIKWDDTYNK